MSWRNLLKTEGIYFLELRDRPMGIFEDGVFLFGALVLQLHLGRGGATGLENVGQASRRVSTRQAESLRHEARGCGSPWASHALRLATR